MPDELTLPRIRRWMQGYTVTAAMLATAIGYSPAHMRKILNGTCRLLPESHEKVITYFTARKDEKRRQLAAMDELDKCA